MRISELGGEDALIEVIGRGSMRSAPGLVLGIGDDAAVVDPAGNQVVVTTDMLVEGTHFRLDLCDPFSLGWKSAAVNISDIAAMGARPTCAFISIGLPDSDVEFVEQFYAGFREISDKFGSVIAGGDTVGSDKGVVIGVTQLGAVEPGKYLTRTGAKPGDAVMVTGTLGDSVMGLELLLKLGLEEARDEYQFLVDRHLLPEPRVREAIALAGTGKVTSMMDISDGLSKDLGRLCKASGVGAKVYSDWLPLSAEMQGLSEEPEDEGQGDCQENTHVVIDPHLVAARGGEDYELLFTCPHRFAGAMFIAMSKIPSPIALIGEITAGQKVGLVGADGSIGEMPSSWEHFSR